MYVVSIYVCMYMHIYVYTYVYNTGARVTEKYANIAYLIWGLLKWKEERGGGHCSVCPCFNQILFPPKCIPALCSLNRVIWYSEVSVIEFNEQSLILDNSIYQKPFSIENADIFVYFYLTKVGHLRLSNKFRNHEISAIERYFVFLILC